MPRSSRLILAEQVIEESELPPVRRVNQSDIDEWLLARIIRQWDGSESQWRSKLTGFSSSNTFWFVTNEHAVILATTLPHVMTGKPVVWEVFAWARDSVLSHDMYTAHRGSMAEFALRALYHQMKRWGQSMGATRIYPGICSDIIPSSIKEMFGGAYYVVGAPC